MSGGCCVCGVRIQVRGNLSPKEDLQTHTLVHIFSSCRHLRLLLINAHGKPTDVYVNSMMMDGCFFIYIFPSSLGGGPFLQAGSDVDVTKINMVKEWCERTRKTEETNTDEEREEGNRKGKNW